jgi:acylphosphatase
VPDLARAHILVEGRVQGVFFRYETRERARRASLSGWVRNTPEGRVEAVFEGPRETVEEMVAWCQQGPDMAAVEDADVRWEEPEGLEGFEVRR